MVDVWGGKHTWAVFALGQLLIGWRMGAENTNEMAYRQTATPDRLQGRMNTTMRSVNRATIVVAAPLGGLLGDAVGYGVGLLIAGVEPVVVRALSLGSRVRGAGLGDQFTSAPAATGVDSLGPEPLPRVDQGGGNDD